LKVAFSRSLVCTCGSRSSSSESSGLIGALFLRFFLLTFLGALPLEGVGSSSLPDEAEFLMINFLFLRESTFEQFTDEEDDVVTPVEQCTEEDDVVVIVGVLVVQCTEADDFVTEIDLVKADEPEASFKHEELELFLERRLV
jgi:hypothetical protein